MASQDANSGAPLWYQPEQESLRLLELPQEVLEAIEKKGDNSTTQISIKSGADPAVSHAVLCTPHKTWQIRQVQTSNSVFLIRPHSVQENESDLPSLGVVAFATCASTLETIEVDGQKDTAKLKTPLQLIQESVPTFFKLSMSTSSMSKRKIFSSLPYSDSELNQAWNSLCCFEHDGFAYRPESVTLVEVWTELFRNSSRQAVDLSVEFNSEELLDDLAYDDHPKQLFETVLRNLVDPTQDGPKTKLDKDTTIAWVGKCLFDSKLHEHNRDKCIAAWQELLPEVWRQEVSAATYDALAAKAGATASKFVELNAKDNSHAAKKPALGNRNWHERLKRTRR